ncbi:hypothetical protein L218DRAFT_177582 [Marasmius fiardii PR-910]|nr:hypothetical protein L218DRAFT_177582 [Marasmius fiardii PR-910]
MFVQGSSLSQFLQTFAFGMYYGVYSKIDTLYAPLEGDEDQGSCDAMLVPARVSQLTHSLPKLVDTLPQQFFSPEDPIQFESCIGELMIGHWSGYITSSGDSRLIQFRIPDWNGADFEGDGSYSEGMIRVEGSYDPKVNVLEATIVGTTDNNTSESGDPDLRVFILGWVDTISFGHLGEQYRISGTWKTSKEGPTEGYITLCQTPAWTYRFKQHHPGRTGNERWKFALQAVLYRVRSERGVLNKAFCFGKLKDIRRSVYCLKQRLFIGALPDEEGGSILSSLAPTDSRLCYWLARFAVWPTVHFNAKCKCGELVVGNRVLEVVDSNLPYVHLEEFCQHEVHPRVLGFEEEIIKAARFLHRRDEFELANNASSLAALVRSGSKLPKKPTTKWARFRRSFMSLFSSRRLSGVLWSAPSKNVDSIVPTLSLPRRNQDEIAPLNNDRGSADLSCVCCGLSLPDENWDVFWVCLMCSVPESLEKVLMMCRGCERMNRRCTDGRFKTHSPYHTLLQMTLWPPSYYPSRRIRRFVDKVGAPRVYVAAS